MCKYLSTFFYFHTLSDIFTNFRLSVETYPKVIFFEKMTKKFAYFKKKQ